MQRQPRLSDTDEVRQADEQPDKHSQELHSHCASPSRGKTSRCAALSVLHPTAGCADSSTAPLFHIRLFSNGDKCSHTSLLYFRVLVWGSLLQLAGLWIHVYSPAGASSVLLKFPAFYFIIYFGYVNSTLSPFNIVLHSLLHKQ